MKNKSENLKIKKKYVIFALIMLVIFILIVTYLFFYEGVAQKNEKEQTDINKTEINDKFPNVKEVHFSDMPITYSLNISTKYGLSERDNTDSYKRERIKWALGLIENETDQRVQFKEVEESENPNIVIYGVPDISCYDENESYDGREGFAGPNVSNNQILNSQVVFCANSYVIGELTAEEEIEVGESNIGFSWYYGACEDFPLVEIHEILHAFGFGHVYDSNKKIMYPIIFRIKSCEVNSIDEKTILCLKYLYSNEEIKGDCNDLNMYPWENATEEEIKDFKWDSLPVTYSVSGCIERQKYNLQLAEKLLEKFTDHDLLKLVGDGYGQINFYCQTVSDEVLLNWETDLWTTTNYFPAAQPEYYFENEKINEVKIRLFGQNRSCGGIELHELLHGLGLRNHYGRWMFYEREVCSEDGTIDRESINALKELYELE